MKRKLTLSFAITLLAFSSLITATVSFAWILSTYPFNNIDNKTGQIDGVAMSKVWNFTNSATNKWEEISTPTPQNQNMGEMYRIDTLPDNTVSYYMFNFTETSEANTHYFLVMESIDILIHDILNDVDVVLPDISYYEGVPSQAAYYYNEVVTTTADQNPVTLFASAPAGTQINTENQVLPSTNLTADQYLYLKFDLNIEELQNIIDVVPLQHSPYILKFVFNFNLEKRTTDNG